MEARRGTHAPLEIHFFCDSVPFSPDTIELNTSLGGSESAMVLLAKALSRRGNTVAIYTRFDLPEGADLSAASMKCQDGVHYFPNHNDIVEPLIRARQPEVFVSLRHFPVMNWSVLIDCKLRILWNEDLLTTPDAYFSAAWQTDLHAFVSRYHEEQYLRAIPDLEGWTWPTVNAIDCARVLNAIDCDKRDPNRLIHISRPERALVAGDGSPLLEIFAKLREDNPALTLGICRYHSMYEGNPRVKAVCDRADELVAEAEGVEWLGELGKDELYREIAGSSLMIYPGVPNFAETGCIAATEAQMCQTPFIGTKIGALPETLHPDGGVLIDGDCTTDEYQAQFVETVRSMLLVGPDGEPCLEYRKAQDLGFKHALKYDMALVAESWERKIKEMFAARYKARRRGVFDRLVMNDDLRAARKLAGKVDGGQAVLDEWTDTANESPESYFENAVSPAAEIQSSPRFQIMGDVLRKITPNWDTWDGRIVNFAAGNGSLAAVLLAAFPAATVEDVDYSPQLLEAGRKFIDTDFRDGEFSDRYTQTCGSFDDIEEGVYDLVLAGEIAEHYEYPEAFLEQLERLARPPAGDTPGGVVFCSVPQGPFKEMMHRNSLDWAKEVRGHKFAFDKRDIEAMLSHKPGFDDVHIPLGETRRSSLCGHFLFHWQRDDQPIHAPDVDRKIARTRPQDRLSVCMIVKDAENDLARCLKSFDHIADEVWIADTGSTDATMHIAKPYTHNGGDVWSIGHCPDALDCPPPGDFSWARNESAKHATGEWILWIDADEAIEHPLVMARYLTDNPFNGYAMKQAHIIKDADDRHDLPVRLFRRVPRGKQAGMSYDCYGAIHEHFQADDNTLIEPALRVIGGDIIHLGYINEKLRRQKCENRNIPLLVRDRRVNPDRVLGRLLEVREWCNLAKWEKEATTKRTGNPNPPVVQWRARLEEGLRILADEFYDPEDKFWGASFDVYQEVLGLLAAGSPFLVADFDAGSGEMFSRELLFANPADYRIFMEDVVKRIENHAKTPEITW